MRAWQVVSLGTFMVIVLLLGAMLAFSGGYSLIECRYFNVCSLQINESSLLTIIGLVLIPIGLLGTWVIVMCRPRYEPVDLLDETDSKSQQTDSSEEV